MEFIPPFLVTKLTKSENYKTREPGGEGMRNVGEGIFSGYTGVYWSLDRLRGHLNLKSLSQDYISVI